MKPFFLLALGCLLLPRASPAAPSFGDAPEDQAAKALAGKIATTWRSDGVEKAIDLLDREGRAFIKNSGATARFDFFSSLRGEAMAGMGRANQEWSLALTEWCYRYCRDVGEDYWLDKFTPEMHAAYFRAGKYGAARAVLNDDRLRQLENQEDLDVLVFPASGLVNEAFPAIAKRTPGKMKNLPTKKFSIFIAQARQDLAEGKWRRAMEAAAMGAANARGMFDWHNQRPNLTDSKNMMTDMTGHWRRLRTVMAEGYRFLDLKEAELEEYRGIDAFNPEEGREHWDVQMAWARAQHLGVVLGNSDSAVLQELEEVRQVLLTPAYNAPDDADRVHLMMADVHFLSGNDARGWEIIDGIRANKGLSRDMKYEVAMEWCRQRVAAKMYDTVETELVGLLEIARAGGLKQREIALYEIYAGLLIGLGRYEDALVIQNELLRLLNSFDLFPRIPAALGQLARIQALMGQSGLAEASLARAKETLEAAKIPGDSKKRIRAAIDLPLPGPAERFRSNQEGTDLQPLRSLTIPLAGLPARGLFTLTNLSGAEVGGKLAFRGSGLVFREAAEGMVAIDADDPKGQPALAREITLPAGSVKLIDISRWEDAGDRESRVSVEWIPARGQPQSAEWKAEREEKAVSIAVTDAGEYMDNPFYLIPIYHLLQYQDTFARAADLRVVASLPARVELYNQKDELVFVDAEGDGAFTSDGDLVSQDLNRNGSGDLELMADVRELRFRVFARPLKIEPGKELTLDLQIFEAGEWTTFSSDRILFPKTGG
jgi:tetratricopeptide (TPR) repeat protein